MAVIKNNNTGESVLLSHVISEALVSKRKTTEADTSIFGTLDQNSLDPRTIRLAVKIFGTDRETRYRKLQALHESNDLMTYVGKRTLTNCEISSISEMTTIETQAIVLTIDLKEVLESELTDEEEISTEETDEGGASQNVQVSSDSTNIGLQPLEEINSQEQELVDEQVLSILDSFGDATIDDIFNGEPEKQSLYQTISSSA